MKRLYVVWDLVAMAVASAVLVYAGDPAAIRGFTDALSDPQGPYAKHAADFQLRCLGELTEASSGPVVEPEVEDGPWGPRSRVVLTGAQWVAMSQPSLVPSSKEA